MIDIVTLLTFVLVTGGHSQNGVLDVLVLVHLGFVETLVKVRRVVILVSNPDTDELRH